MKLRFRRQPLPTATPVAGRPATRTARRVLPYVLLGGIALAAGSGIWLYLEEDLAGSERLLLRQSTALAEAVSAQAQALLDGMDQALLGLGRHTGEAPDLAVLEMREASAPDGVSLTLLNRDGQILRATPGARTRLAGVEAGTLAALAQAVPPELPPHQMLVLPPLRSTMGPLLPMLRRLQDGSLALATLPTRLLEGFYARINFSQGASTLMMDEAGHPLARFPPLSPELVGTRIAGPAGMLAVLRTQTSWTGPAVSVFDGLRRYTTMKPVPGHAISIAVGVLGEDILARWHQRATLSAVLAVLLLAAAAVAILLLERGAARRLRAQAAATARLRRLAEGSAGIASRTELPALLSYIAGLTRTVLGTPFACVTLWDTGAEAGGQAGEPQLRQSMAWDEAAPFPPPLARALEAWSALPATDEPRAFPNEELPTRLAIAITGERREVLGTLTVATRAPTFSADEEAALAQLARVAGIAIQNRRLLAAAQRAAEEAGTARARIGRLLEAVEDGFIALDARWRIIYANAVALRGMGYPQGVPPETPIWELLPETVELEIFEQLHAVASLGEPRSFDQFIPSTGRVFHLHAFAAGDGVGVFFRPLPRGTALPPAAPATEPAALSPMAPHLLLVEDEPALRQALAARLGRLGFRVTALGDGSAALEALESGLRPDVLLADVILPGVVSGPRLVVLARRHLPGLPAMLTSGYALGEEATAEGEALIAKPCASEMLAARLHNLLEESGR